MRQNLSGLFRRQHFYAVFPARLDRMRWVVLEIGDGIGRDVHAGRTFGHALEVGVQGGRLVGGREGDYQRSETSDRI
jgi:hypothetical protein